MRYQFWNIELDGPDKTGKSTIGKYLSILSNFRFATHDRGYMTQVAYSKKFNRQYEYSTPDKSHTVYILFYCDKVDHDIRCSINNEPKIDFLQDMKYFEEAYQSLEHEGYHCMKYNTSEMTAYSIALDIISKIDALERTQQ